MGRLVEKAFDGFLDAREAVRHAAGTLGAFPAGLLSEVRAFRGQRVGSIVRTVDDCQVGGEICEMSSAWRVVTDLFDRLSSLLS